MKTPQLLGCLVVLAVTPLAALADRATDRRIEDAAENSYNFRTVIKGDVDVKALDGTVTLTGTVGDMDQKRIAEDTVRSLPGVARVDNQLRVEPAAAAHSDEWIALKIRSVLLVKANVSATDTRVTVRDGVVTLTGTAETQAQKELTEAYVKDIEGVKSVTNDLVVSETPVPPKRTMGERIDDASITAQVKYALLTHRSTSAMKTEVMTKDGIVTVQGEAASDAEKALVTKLVQDVRGVQEVRNEMTVRGGM
jgi:hyperosmotically inducible protein